MGLLHINALRRGQVIFGGRLPEHLHSLKEEGVIDDDVAHFENIVLGKPEVQARLREYSAKRVALDDFRAVETLSHADGSWVDIDEAKALQCQAKEAMQLLWAFYEAFRVATQEALEKVALLVVSTDMALNIYAKAAVPTLPAMRLMQRKKAMALMMEAVQRCPIETYVALASRRKTLVAVGDRGQELYPQQH